MVRKYSLVLPSDEIFEREQTKTKPFQDGREFFEESHECRIT